MDNYPLTKNELKTKDLGFFGENIAQHYLIDKDYVILERNYKKPWGEIDIIAEKNNTITFVEVKTNNGEKLNFEPELRVNGKKIGHISRVALTFLENEGALEKEWQIDIISVTIDSTIKKAKIKHFKNIASNIY